MREHVAAVRTLLARMNVRVPVVSWLLGHSDVRTTLRYAYLADKEIEARPRSGSVWRWRELCRATKEDRES